MSSFISMLSGPSGKTSAMRSSMLLGVLLVLGPKAVIGVATMTAQTLTEVDVMALAVVYGAKVWQRSVETKEPQVKEP